MPPRRRILLLGLALGGAIGAAVTIALPAFERRMLYYPVPGRTNPAADGPAIQVVEIKTSDGETLVGWWLPPADETRPVILFFNGNGDSLPLQTGRWSRIADQGVGFLSVAYRGFDGSTGKPSEAGLHQDSLAAYAWLTKQVPSDRVVIHGFSLGSGVATRLASEKPARALILEAPFTAAADVAKERMPWAPVALLMRDQFLSRERIGKVTAPLLIIHGDQDSVVPFRQGQALFARANQPKTFVRMVGSDHNTLARDGLYDHVWRFLGVPFDGTTAYEGRAAPVEVTATGG